MQEFEDYFANVSSFIDSDALFELIMTNVWNLMGKELPFAGSNRKITNVNARDAYRNDHHRNLFGTDDSAVFSKQQSTDWKSTKNNHFTTPDTTKFVPTAGGSMAATSGSDDPHMQWVKQINKVTPADYQGIRKSDD